MLKKATLVNSLDFRSLNMDVFLCESVDGRADQSDQQSLSKLAEFHPLTRKN